MNKYVFTTSPQKSIPPFLSLKIVDLWNEFALFCFLRPKIVNSPFTISLLTPKNRKKRGLDVHKTDTIQSSLSRKWNDNLCPFWPALYSIDDCSLIHWALFWLNFGTFSRIIYRFLHLSLYITNWSIFQLQFCLILRPKKSFPFMAHQSTYCSITSIHCGFLFNIWGYTKAQLMDGE